MLKSSEANYCVRGSCISKLSSHVDARMRLNPRWTLFIKQLRCSHSPVGLCLPNLRYYVVFQSLDVPTPHLITELLMELLGFHFIGLFQ